MVLTAKTRVFSGLSEAVVAARWISLLVGVGSDHVASWSVVADIQLGVASSRIVVEGEAAANVRCFAPDQLKIKCKR